MTLTNLNRTLNRERLNSLQNGSRISRTKRRLLRKLIFLFMILVIFGFATYFPARGAYNAAKEVMISGQKIAAGVKSENLDLIKEGVVETKSSLNGLNLSLNFLFWVRFIPYFGGYYIDAKHFTNAAIFELEAAETVIRTLEPHKQELGLIGQGTPGQDRVAQAVKILDKLVPEIDKIEPSLKKAREEVENIDTSKYPETYRGRQVRTRIEEAKNFIIGAHIAVTDAKDALFIAPDALGAKSPKTYLLLFQNDKELRATGGFITAYAFLQLDKGHLSTTSSDDIYRLDERLLKVCETKICPLTPPEPIVKYLPEFDGKARTAWSMRDSNLSPDLSLSLQEFERMYKMIDSSLPFDGIITIDTQVVEELIAITGPIDVFGTLYSAEMDERCNCPNVIYELERYAEITSKGEADRKEVVGTLMQQILAKSLNVGPEQLLNLIQTAIRLANHKHVMFYMHDEKTQQALTNLGWTGQIKKFDGDYLHINDSNFAGGKTNLYIEEDVLYEIEVKDGKAKAKLSINYQNPQPFSSWLNTVYRDYVRVYVPKGSKLISSKGSDEKVKTSQDDELDKTYFEAFITVRPENSRVLEFEYELPIEVSGDKYPLLIQKQPGAKDHTYTVKINGKTQEEFMLDTDKEFSFPI